MFPNDAITIFHELEGVGSYQLLPTGSYTVLGVSIQQSSVASLSQLYCGGAIIAKNYAKDLTYNSIHYICNDTLSVSKTGQDDASFIITYVPYNMSLLATSTGSRVNGFTYGEVLIILVLLMIFTQAFFSELKQWFFGVRIENPMKNKYNKDL